MQRKKIEFFKNEIFLKPEDNEKLRNLCGPFNNNIKFLEKILKIKIYNRKNYFKFIGNTIEAKIAIKTLQNLYDNLISTRNSSSEISYEDIHLSVMKNKFLKERNANLPNEKKYQIIKTKNKIIKSRTINQSKYIANILNHVITFGIGPAGTGKTFLAVVSAINYLEQQKIKRIVLVRPAVEAGEKLGFLPGSFNQKIDPYFRPLYDALFEIIGYEKVEKFINNNTIEIAPLAYMRGRTLNDAFIILDESQNTTIKQMKMFLTRIGFNSKVVITGDITQIDLPKNYKSGLQHAVNVFSKIQEISFNFFSIDDISRNPIIVQIINAYEIKH